MAGTPGGTTGKKPFVRTEGDEVTFNLAALREAAQKGLAVLDVVADDVETSARRASSYLGSIVERATERLNGVNCPNCNEVMASITTEGKAKYSCTKCGAEYTPPPVS